MSDVLKKFDSWLNDDGPAALVIREYLTPVEGPDGVLFPSTFAGEQGNDPDRFKGGYNIDTFDDGTNCCLIDSVGSQANRIEPLFTTNKYAGLVPQVTIQAGEKMVNLLEAGHRAGDAIVRCTRLQPVLQDAFKAAQRGDVEPLAKIAPTSLVFGAWDSRNTGAKVPRLIASAIRAFNVKPMKRSANYLVQQHIDYVKDGLLPEPADKGEKEQYSSRGYQNALATQTHGGVIATGGVRRDATLSLAALRLLNAGTDKNKTESLRRYILGLSLVAFTYRPSSYLRQGCNLVADPDKPAEFVEVRNDGRRHPAKITHDDAIAYAVAAAKAFGIGKDQQVEFDKELAKKDVQGDDSGAAKPEKSAAGRKNKNK